MKRIGSFQLEETLETERALREFVKLALPYLFESVYQTIDQLLLTRDIDDTIDDTIDYISSSSEWDGNYIIGDVSISFLLPKVKDDLIIEFLEYWVERNPYGSLAVEYAKDASFGGRFSPNFSFCKYTITREEVLEELVNSVDKYKMPKPETKLSKILFGIENTFVHELTHAYDGFRSKEKIFKKSYVGANSEENLDVYYQQDLEVNAFYSSAIESLEKTHYKYTTKFSNVLQSFKGGYYAGKFRLLSDKQKERLIKRLYAWYSEPPQGAIEQKKALRRYYDSVLPYVFRNSIYDNKRFYRSVFISGFEREFKKFTPPSLRGLVSGEEGYNFAKRIFFILKRSSISTKDLSGQPDKKYYYLRHTKEIIEFFSELVPRFYRDLFDGVSVGGDEMYDFYVEFFKFLAIDVKYSFHDFEKINDLFSYKRKEIFPLNILREHPDFENYL